MQMLDFAVLFVDIVKYFKEKKMQFSNFVLPINEITVILFLTVCICSYYFIFKEHHKKNELKFHEIYPRVINYLILCIISFFVLVFGIDTVFTGYVFNDEIYELIKELFTGFAIISIDIVNFIFYIKRNKVDLIQEEREAQDEKDSKTAEIIELILLIAMIILPIINIFRYLRFAEESEQLRQIVGGLLFIAIAVFLLFSLNPLNIRSLLKKDVSKK